MSNKWDGVYYNHPVMHDALCIYDSHTKEEFLPCVGYIQDGKIVDTLFDAFFFTRVYTFISDTVDNWVEYMDKVFEPEKNLDALEAAVGEVKEALGLPDYRVTVFMTAFPPRKGSPATAGHGQHFALPDSEERKRATRWQADEQIRRFCERNYKNLRLAGFHWPVEDASVTDPELYYVGWDFTDHIRSLGWETNWGPYFKASGYDCYRELGFDIGILQPNYFGGGSPNAGGPERLRTAAQIMRETGMGFSPELEHYTRDGVRVFKDYLRFGEMLGYMYAFHVWYAPGLMLPLSGSADSFISSVYGDIYHFIKRNLDPDSVILE